MFRTADFIVIDVDPIIITIFCRASPRCYASAA